MSGLACVILAAGEGQRLRPLTRSRPKPLCPVGGRPLLEWAFERVAPWGSGPDDLAVNAFHLADQVVEAVGARARVSVETELMGTAGALGVLSEWIAGRDVLLTNADALLLDENGCGTDVLRPLFVNDEGVDRGPVVGPRLLVTRPVGHAADFPDAGDERGWRYVGACLLPSSLVARCRPEPSGLYSVMWEGALRDRTLEFVELRGTHVDCGTPADYLAANLLVSGGESVVGAGAVVDGEIDQCVVWEGAYVGSEESLRRVIRAGDRAHPLTVRP